MELVLRAKHWQIVIGILALGAFSKLGLFFNIGFLGVITYSFGSIIPIIWYGLIGIQLKKKIGSRLPHLFVLFICSAMLMISIFCITLPVLYFNTELVLTIGDKPLFFPFLVLLLFLVFNLAIFPAKALRILEIGEDIDINDYFGDIFRILNWPIGIWNIQPRLNKIAEKNEENIVSSLK